MSSAPIQVPRSVSVDVNLSALARSADRVGSLLKKHSISSFSPPRLSINLSASRILSPRSSLAEGVLSKKSAPSTPIDEILGSDHVLEWLQCGEASKHYQLYVRKIDPALGTYTAILTNSNDVCKLKVHITALNFRNHVILHKTKTIARGDKVTIPIDLSEDIGLEQVELQFKLKLDTLSNVKKGAFSIELFHSECYGNSFMTF
jgi:hypothetical protein